jgi:hypothetical protein
MSTKFVKLALGFGIVIVIGAVAATAIGGRHPAAVPTAQPPSTKASTAESENPLDTATPGETPSMLADNLISTLKIKIVGQWGEYGVFDLKVDPAGGLSSLKFPLTVDGNTYDDVYSLSTQLLPLNSAQANKYGVICNVICWGPGGVVIGYNLSTYSDYAKQNNLPPIPPNQIAYVQGVEKLTAAPAPVVAVVPEDVKRVDGSTDSDVPVDVIRSAIDANKDLTQFGAYPVQTWKETNTYTRKIDDETVVIIELHGTFHLLPKDMALVGPDTRESYLKGLKYTTAQYDKDGQVALVKRGKDWYIYKR